MRYAKISTQNSYFLGAKTVKSGFSEGQGAKFWLFARRHSLCKLFLLFRKNK